MPSNPSNQIEDLKNCVLTAANLTSITPADCKTISALIFFKTRHNLSPTTIKRIYGFAYSEFNPSAFTLDVLAKYCGYIGWTDFYEQKMKVLSAQSAALVSWGTVKQHADRVTLYTLKVLENKSGIPYHHTIERQFASDHFDLFLQDDYNACALIAPAGYGKTIALCHWVNKRLALNKSQHSNDIILVLSGSVLVSNFINGINLNDWIFSLLGYDGKGDIIALISEELKEGRFFLIIDAFDEFLFKAGHFQLLLDELVSIITLYQEYHWFKVILTMRSATWINYKHIFTNGQSNWFHSFVCAETRAVNVPLFDKEELEELCAKINPNRKHRINIDAFEILSNPLYFQFYYQSGHTNFNIDNVGQVSMHQIISSYILTKIYLGIHAAEKQLLIQGLIACVDIANKNYVIEKIKVYGLIKSYPSAYNELISTGYLKELNTSSNQRFINQVEFGNNYFLGHAVAHALFSDNKYLFNEHLIVKLNLIPDGVEKIFLLKWCVFFAVKAGQYDDLKCIAQSGLTSAAKADLLLFLTDLFEKEFLQVPQVIEKQFAGEYNNDLFDYFFGLEFINTAYERSLITLLKFKLTEQRQISVYTSLAIIAVIQMDTDKLESYLLLLKKFSPDDFEAFPINPFNCLETIYAYLKHGIIKQHTFKELTKFYFNPTASVSSNSCSGTNDVIYLLAVHTLTINNNPHKTLRIINAVRKVYCADASSQGFKFFLKLVEIESCFLSKHQKEGSEVYKKSLEEFHVEKCTYTPFMKALFYLLKIKMMLYHAEPTYVFQALKPLINLTEEAGYKLIKAQSLALMLTNPTLINNDSNYYKTAQHDFTKMLRESGFREKSFLDSKLFNRLDELLCLNVG